MGVRGPAVGGGREAGGGLEAVPPAELSARQEDVDFDLGARSRVALEAMEDGDDEGVGHVGVEGDALLVAEGEAEASGAAGVAAGVELDGNEAPAGGGGGGGRGGVGGPECL